MTITTQKNGFTYSECFDNADEWVIRDAQGREVARTKAVRHATRITDLLNAE